MAAPMTRSTNPKGPGGRRPSRAPASTLRSAGTPERKTDAGRSRKGKSAPPSTSVRASSPPRASAPSVPAIPSAMPRSDAPTVLVVDDDPKVRALLVRLLGRSYCVYEAEDGAHALALLATMPTPDAVLLDVMMPGIDGFEVAKLVRVDARLHAVPIIFLTARASLVDVVAGVNVGARYYVTKPFRSKDLLDRVAAAVLRR